MMLKYIIVVLRIEQGFPNSLYDTDDQAHKQYAGHHRFVVPSIAAYDIYQKSDNGIERLEKVLSGVARSATLCIALDNIKDAPLDEDWIEIRDYLGIGENTDTLSDWRIAQDKNARHYYYDEYGVWSATRNLIQLDEVRVRERYTFTAKKSVSAESITAMVEEGADINPISDDILLATATVYALDKTIPKPKAEEPKTDWSLYPALNSLRNQK